MANGPTLTSSDSAVLSKVFDPESAPDARILVDPLLPADPNIQDEQTLVTITKEEKAVIKAVEEALRSSKLSSVERSQIFADALDRLSRLIVAYPNSASLRNNRAQLFRLQYGDNILLLPVKSSKSTDSFVPAATTMSDLGEAIRLLSPVTPHSAVSPTQCRVLAQAYTQRAALYHAASKRLALGKDSLLSGRNITLSLAAVKDWQVHDFEEAASKDFFMGGRYGNEIGKVLAVYTNPTAKLCGQMVQEAMRREFTSNSQASN